jgi:hypothetical protein
MRTLGLLCAALMAAWLAYGPARAAEEGKPYKVRGTLVEVNDQRVTVLNDDEETSEVALTKDTRVIAATPAKLSDIKPGSFVGITSVASDNQRVALEVHIFAEDMRGTGEGHYAWDLIKDPNMMTNATVAEIKEVSPAERQLRLTYKEGEGDAAQGEQVITVPDFVDVVFLAKSEDSGLIVPDRRVFMLVQDSEQGPPAAIAVAVGLEGAIPPM